MKVALVQCPEWTVETPPIAIGYLAGYLKQKGYDVDVFDFNVEAYTSVKNVFKHLWTSDRFYWSSNTFDQKKFFRKETDRWAKRILDSNAEIIGFSIVQESKRLSIEVAKRIKEEDKSKLIVFGGSECIRGWRLENLLKEKFVDVFIIGEGEETLFEIVRQWEKNKKIKFCPGAILRNKNKIIDCGVRLPIQDIDLIPFPDFTDLPLTLYISKKKIPMLSSRGCFNRCRFCADYFFWEKYRVRSAKNIFEEMMKRFKDGYTDFEFCDNLLNGNLKVLGELCDLILGSEMKGNITWTGMPVIRSDMGMSLLNKMRNAGCRDVRYGIDSGSDKILKNMNKSYNTKIASIIIRKTHLAGIPVGIHLIVGFPGEDEKTINETISFIKKNKDYIDKLIVIQPLSLRPGSEVGEHPEKFGIRRLSEDPCDWISSDGINTPIWRLEKCHDMWKSAKSMGIEIEYDEIHRYFIPAIKHWYETKNYKKVYEVALEALEKIVS
jgi:radical SAM superfamily enzyme YgiQ (UPF0313 family)